MFGDFNVSIFSTAPTRVSQTQSSPVGPVGGTQPSPTTHGANQLFAPPGGFNVSAPFQATGPTTDGEAAHSDHSVLPLHTPTHPQAFQVNQLALGSGAPPRHADVGMLFNHASNLPAPTTTVGHTLPRAGSNGGLTRDALSKGYSGSLSGMQGGHGVGHHDASLQSLHALMPTPQQQALGDGALERGRRLRLAKQASSQSLPLAAGGRLRYALSDEHKGSGTDLHDPAGLAARKSRAGGVSRELVKRQTTKSEAQELLTRTVHMRCLPPLLTQMQLAQFLSECGPFDRVRVCTNGRANQKWVYGFVEFTHAHGAEVLLTRSGCEMGVDTDGKPLWIKCIRAAQPIQDLLPSDAEPSRGRPCLFGRDARASQTIASLAATPAGALWEQAKGNLPPPGPAGLGGRHLSDDAVSSTEEAWEPSDRSLQSPHLFKEDTIANHNVSGSVTGGWTTPESRVGGTSQPAQEPIASRVSAPPSTVINAAPVSANAAPREDTSLVLAAVWTAYQQLSGTEGLCINPDDALHKLQSDVSLSLRSTTECAGLTGGADDAVAAKVGQCLELWAALQAFMSAHEIVLAAVPFDTIDDCSSGASSSRGGRRGLALYVYRFTAHLAAALLALRAVQAHRAAARAAVGGLLRCFTLYYPTPSTAIARPGQNSGRRGKATTSAVSEVFVWSLNMLGVLLSHMVDDTLATEREGVASILAIYVSASRADTKLFPGLGEDIYALNVAQFANMLSHALAKTTSSSSSTLPEALQALAAAGCSSLPGKVSASQLVRHASPALLVL